MKCSVCGNDLPEKAKFCNSCGARVIKNEGEAGIEYNVVQKNDEIVNMGNNSSPNNNFSNFNALNNDVNLVNTSNVNFDNSNNQNLNDVMITNDNANNFQNKHNKGKKTILLVIILFIIALIVGALLYFFNQKTNAKQVFINGVKEVTSKLFVKNNKNYTSITTNFDVKYNNTTNDSNLSPIFNITNKLGFSGSMSMDYKNKIINGNLKINYDNNKLTDVVIYGEKENLYLYLDGLFDKYISIPVDFYDKLFNDNKIELNNIKEGIDTAFEVALKDKYLSTKKETITIDGNNKEVNSNILTINNSNADDFVNDLTHSLANDNDFISSIAKISNNKEKDIKELLLRDQKSDLDEDEKIIITIYTDSKNNFVGLEVKIVNEDENSIFTVYQVDKFNYILKVEEDNQKFEVKVNKKLSNNNETYTISSNIDSSKIVIILSNNTVYNDKVNILDVKNNINYEEISIDDINKIQESLMQNNAFIKIKQDIDKISGTNLSSIY